jgi:hypothetical protein
MTIVAIALFRDLHMRIPHYIPYPVHAHRYIKDCNGKIFDYVVSLRRSALLSFLVGIISPIVGIGGGVLRVPPMILVLGIPAKVAAATSLVITFAGSLIAVILFAGNSQIDYMLAVPLAVGVITGSQAGALVSNKIDTRLIRLSMSVTILFVGVWMLLGVFL